MIKRLAGLLIPITITLIFIGSLIIYQKDQNPDWEAPLTDYRSYLAAQTGKDFDVCSIDKANYPWEFKPEMSYRAFSNTPYYQTISDKVVSSSASKIQENDITFTYIADGRRPLPFPPTEVWCAQLQPSEHTQKCSKKSPSWIVIIATHVDLYNADMVIHELDPDSNSFKTSQIIQALGCNLER